MINFDNFLFVRQIISLLIFLCVLSNTIEANDRKLPVTYKNHSNDFVEGGGNKSLEEVLLGLTNGDLKWHIDGSNGAIVFEEAVVIDLKTLKKEELERVHTLAETGMLENQDVKFDLRNVAIIIDHNDLLSKILSSAFSPERNIKDSKSPMLSPSLSASEVLEELIKRLGSDGIYLDASSNTFVVTGDFMSTVELDQKIYKEVLAIVTSGKLWRAPSGTVYDFQMLSDIMKDKLIEYTLNITETRSSILEAFAKKDLFESWSRASTLMDLKPFNLCNRSAKKNK